MGFHKDSGMKVAIKIIKKELLEQKPLLQQKVAREIAVLKLLSHPNVVKLFALASVCFTINFYKI